MVKGCYPNGAVHRLCMHACLCVCIYMHTKTDCRDGLATLLWLVWLNWNASNLGYKLDHATFEWTLIKPKKIIDFPWYLLSHAEYPRVNDSGPIMGTRYHQWDT